MFIKQNSFRVEFIKPAVILYRDFKPYTYCAVNVMS